MLVVLPQTERVPVSSWISLDEMCRSWLLPVLFVAGCGEGVKQRPAEPRWPKPVTWQVPPIEKGRPLDQWTGADEDLWMPRACTNVVAPDGSLRCPSLVRFGLDPKNCLASFKTLRTTVPEGDRLGFRIIVAGLSVANSCETVDATFQLAARQVALQHVATAAPPTERTGSASSPDEVCKRREDGSFDLSSEDVLKRRGLGDRLFSDTVSTEEKPIEVCGLKGEIEWLTGVTCADGSRPWGRDMHKAHAGRHGSTAGAARCGDPFGPMVDIYEVPCPEKRYAVYMDMYECGPGESFRAN